MPLWLFTLGTTFYEANLSLPWKNILGSLVGFMIPIGLGMIFGWRKQHLVDRIRPVIKRFTVVLMIFTAALYSYANW